MRYSQHPPSLILWLVLLGILLGLSNTVSATEHDGDDHHKPAKVGEREMATPTQIPDRIILTWSDDPTTTQSVTWRTSTQVEEAFAEIAVATPGPEFVKTAVRHKAESVALKTDLNTAHFHSLVFKQLQPGTKYAYRVGDGINWSEWFQFRTANIQPEAFSFVYFGDAQNDLRSMWSRVVREAYSDAPKARFLLHAGDLINNAQSDGQWHEWFGAGAWLNAMIPSVPVVGNHEMHKGADDQRGVTHHWRPQFALPRHGPEGLEETCYSFVYSNCRIVVLNSNLKIEEQAKWLDKLLLENTAPWVICSFHHPIFSTANDRDNASLRKAWKPILDKHNVDLVLQGHDHTYGRTGIKTPTESAETTGNVPTGLSHRDEHTGTVYVVSVSGPKMYNIEPKPFMVRVAEDTQLYQVIHVDQMNLRYESRTADGQLYDAFELKKQLGMPNELVEIPAQTPERRRTGSKAIAPEAANPAPAAPTPQSDK